MLTTRERETVQEVFAQYTLTPAELVTTRAELPAAIEDRAAVKQASSFNFQGGDAYHAAHTVAARIERERA